MGLQDRLQAELKVSVYIKQELPGRLKTHQLQRLGIKENIEILRFFLSFAAITGTSGRIMDGNESQCHY
jgi:hypothetical protein